MCSSSAIKFEVGIEPLGCAAKILGLRRQDSERGDQYIGFANASNFASHGYNLSEENGQG